MKYANKSIGVKNREALEAGYRGWRGLVAPYRERGPVVMGWSLFCFDGRK